MMSNAASSQHRNAILPGGRAGGLNDVVLPAVVAFREEPERDEAEEGRDDRDIRPEAEFQDDVRIRGADDQRDEQADGDRPRRELANVRGLVRTGF
jgi:hypothetical protein